MRLIIPILLLAAACVPAEAIQQARENAAINRAHAADESLPPQARAIAEDNADAWEAQHYILDPDAQPSAGTRERSEAREEQGQ